MQINTGESIHVLVLLLSLMSVSNVLPLNMMDTLYLLEAISFYS